jgi:hypothetical protein
MCLEIWKLMKFIIGALIWLILVAPHMVAAETEQSLESAAHSQVVAPSMHRGIVLPTAVKISQKLERKKWLTTTT